MKHPGVCRLWSQRQFPTYPQGWHKPFAFGKPELQMPDTGFGGGTGGLTGLQFGPLHGFGGGNGLHCGPLHGFLISATACCLEGVAFAPNILASQL